MIPYGLDSDSEQCSNRLELDLISLLVNFSCELVHIMTRYDFLFLTFSQGHENYKFFTLYHEASPDGSAVWGVVVSTRWWLLVDHCVLRNWDRILVRAVKGLISRAGMVSICPLLWQRDVKLQQTKHCTMNGGHFVDPITHWTIWLWPLIMISTVSWHDVVVHNTYCFDLDLSSMLLKVTNNFPLFYNGCSTKRRGFDSVGVTLSNLTWISFLPRSEVIK